MAIRDLFDLECFFVLLRDRLEEEVVWERTMASVSLHPDGVPASPRRCLETSAGAPAEESDRDMIQRTYREFQELARERGLTVPDLDEDVLERYLVLLARAKR